MKKFCQTIVAAFSVSLLLVGCGGKTEVPTDTLQAEFGGASAEAKKEADAAIAAIKADNYFGALKNLNKLLSMSNDLNQAQIEAARTTFALASTRSLEEGNEAAKKQSKTGADELLEQAKGSE